jgi:anti-sigma-K factor RskA
MSLKPHEEFEDAIAAYAVDALDPQERPGLEAHLAVCAACRAELDDTRKAAAGLGLSLESENVEPPVLLRQRIVDTARRDPRARARVGDQKPTPIHAMSFIPAWTAAAALILFFGAGAYAWRLRQDAAVQRAGKDQEIARNAALMYQLSSLEHRFEVMSAPDVRRVDLAAQPDAPGSTASAFMSAKRGMVFTADGLPALQTGRTYQLWVVTKHAPVSVGTFIVDASGKMTGVMPMPADAANEPVAVAVTIEPAGGVPAPTGPKVLVGVLAPQ